MRNSFRLLFLASLSLPLMAQEYPPPAITNFLVEGAVKTIEWNLAPAMDDYSIHASRRLGVPFRLDPSGVMRGGSWVSTNFSGTRFWQLQYTPMSSNALLSANLLNRIAYGPSPDDLERLKLIGPQAYLEEQMAPEGLPPLTAPVTSVITNGVNPVPGENWSSITVTGRVTSSTVYMYLREPGELYLDDVQLRLINTIMVTNIIGTNEVITTEEELGPNVLVNGDFESSLDTGWNVSGNMSGSTISSATVCTGLGSLHMVASSPGTSRGSSIYQDISPELPTSGGQRCVLRFNYLPSPTALELTIRLSGSGTIASGMDEEGPPEWIYAEASGRSTSGPRVYVYISGSGEAWLDNVRLVEGEDINVGPNLIQNGDFESTLSPPWELAPNFAGSFIDDSVSFAGAGSLRLVASGAGSGGGNSVFQTVPIVNDGETVYTMGYWYRPATRQRTLTVRLSGGPPPG
jgi:hypothetical protein